MFVCGGVVQLLRTPACHAVGRGSPEDKARLEAYESGPTVNLGKQIMKGFELTAAADADVSDVAKAIVNVVDMPFGARPFRVHIDPLTTEPKSSTVLPTICVR